MTEQTESGGVTSRIETRVIETARIATGVRERPACSPASDDHTIVFVHGNVSSSLFFEHLLEDLPDDIRGVAIDLRGFGGAFRAQAVIDRDREKTRAFFQRTPPARGQPHQAMRLQGIGAHLAAIREPGRAEAVVREAVETNVFGSSAAMMPPFVPRTNP